MKQPRINTGVYIIADAIVAIITWLGFYYFRSVIYHFSFQVPSGFFLGLVLYTAGWLILHFITGTYYELYQKSRVAEAFKTIVAGLIGSLVLLLFFVLKNPRSNNYDYYGEYCFLLVSNIVLLTIVRTTILSFLKKQLREKKVFFNSMLIGSGKKAEQFIKDFTESNDRSGYVITDFINLNGKKILFPENKINVYHSTEGISEIIKSERIEEVIIAVENSERAIISSILQKLSNQNVNIKITPDTLDIISGALQNSNVMGVPLIDVHFGQMKLWQQNIKRLTDIIMALAGSIIISPVLIYAVIRLKLSSKGPVFYAQERIGYKGRPFTMYKLRSMVVNAEQDGPMLSSDLDPRITSWGKVMRKWRLDELPQLWNIIKGDMSMVGPRPERKFYIDQLISLHPEYKYLFKVKPGLTSWGMVKFGYASSVEEMITRMHYDLIYVENVSLSLDLKIMLHTISIILSGKGK